MFVVDVQAQSIVEYAHGAMTPIATLNDSGNYPVGCFVNPTTGDLAVAGVGGTGNVAIYPNASGAATLYTDPQIRSFYFCSYDNQGNLFVVGQRSGNFDDSGVLEALVHGGNVLSEISVNHKFNGFGSIQWSGELLAIDNARGQMRNEHGPSTILQVKVAQSKGRVVNTIDLISGSKQSLNPGMASSTGLKTRRSSALKARRVTSNFGPILPAVNQRRRSTFEEERSGLRSASRQAT